MGWLCFLDGHKRVHITDIIIGYNSFKQPMRRGLWQCSRCKRISKGTALLEPTNERMNGKPSYENNMKTNRINKTS